MSDLPNAQITIGDLYHELVGVRTDVSKALVSLEVINATNTVADQIHRDHETRLRALEAWRWKLAGVLVVVAILIGFVSAWLSDTLAQHH